MAIFRYGALGSSLFRQTAILFNVETLAAAVRELVRNFAKAGRVTKAATIYIEPYSFKLLPNSRYVKYASNQRQIFKYLFE